MYYHFVLAEYVKVYIKQILDFLGEFFSERCRMV